MSVTTMTEGPAVMIGYPWRLQIEAAAPVFVDGQKTVTLRGEHIAEEFQAIVLDYVKTRYGKS